VNPKLDQLIDAAAIEPEADKRREMIRQALAEHNANVHHVPLHRQMIPWAMRQQRARRAPCRQCASTWSRSGID
jgi:hypothetical protein